jgi:hypothetical protein
MGVLRFHFKGPVTLGTAGSRNGPNNGERMHVRVLTFDGDFVGMAYCFPAICINKGEHRRGDSSGERRL